MVEALVTLVVTSALLLGSPGPAPLALAATSASVGIKKSLPFYFGILLGLAAAIIGAVFGIAILFTITPQAKLAIQIVGVMYLLYVTYKIAIGPTGGGDESELSVPTLLDGFILNLLNPKAYAAFLAIFGHFVLPFQSATTGIAVTAVVCFLVAVIVDYIWLVLGKILNRLFHQEKSARRLRYLFASLILLMVIMGFLI